MVKKLKKHTTLFPDCCEGHKKLHTLTQFKKDNFIGLEEMIADKIIFLQQHVTNWVDIDDWFDDFIDYFEYLMGSLGSFPNGYGAPFQITNIYLFAKELIEMLKGKLKSDKISGKEIDLRIDKIVQFIEDSLNNYSDDDDKTYRNCSTRG